jgi:hypothetical protein
MAVDVGEPFASGLHHLRGHLKVCALNHVNSDKIGTAVQLVPWKAQCRGEASSIAIPLV